MGAAEEAVWELDWKCGVHFAGGFARPESRQRRQQENKLGMPQPKRPKVDIRDDYTTDVFGYAISVPQL